MSIVKIISGEICDNRDYIRALRILLDMVKNYSHNNGKDKGWTCPYEHEIIEVIKKIDWENRKYVYSTYHHGEEEKVIIKKEKFYYERRHAYVVEIESTTKGTYRINDEDTRKYLRYFNVFEEFLKQIKNYFPQMDDSSKVSVLKAIRAILVNKLEKEEIIQIAVEAKSILFWEYLSQK